MTTGDWAGSGSKRRAGTEWVSGSAVAIPGIADRPLERPEVIGVLDRVVQDRPEEARLAAHNVIRQLADQAKARQLTLHETYGQLREIEAGIREVQAWLADLERRDGAAAVDSGWAMD